MAIAMGFVLIVVFIFVVLICFTNLSIWWAILISYIVAVLAMLLIGRKSDDEIKKDIEEDLEDMRKQQNEKTQ